MIPYAYYDEYLENNESNICSECGSDHNFVKWLEERLYEKESMTHDAVLCDVWRDAREESPNKTGVYATYTYPTRFNGEIYSCELYSKKHGGWCDAEHPIDIWVSLPDPPSYRLIFKNMR